MMAGSVMLPPWFLGLVLLLHLTAGVDRGNFKTCDQSSFCRRNRKMQPGVSSYELQLNTLKVGAFRVEGGLLNRQNTVALTLEITTLADNTVRMTVKEASPLKPRYEVEYALVGEPEQLGLQVVERTAETVTLVSGVNKIVLTARPFRVDLYSGDQLAISANARGLMKFEHTRLKDNNVEDKQDEEAEQEEGQEEHDEGFADVAEDDESGLWEETFKSHTDSKPNGPTSVGLDFSFVSAEHVYGIPEHADKFALRDTQNSDPYRLYNLDVFEYELNNPMALYGSVPVMIAHGVSRTVGVFWHNAAETWVDINVGPNRNVMSSITNFLSGSSTTPQVDTHWYSESGIMDVFFMLGPGSKDVMRQYAKLTGTTPLPPLFAIAYHQCRWNYNDQEDVRQVDAGFDEHDIPYDVIWLDIEHTDNKKYFTWDKMKFSDSKEMIQNLTAKGRKMVTIIDPHIKKDSYYFIHKACQENGWYTKNKDGNDYEGWCWPGAAYYPDLLRSEVREYFASQYALDKYEGSTLDLYTWNDMNEPSVFNGPEVTMHKDAVHHGGWEHRDIHNLYGMLFVMATYKGQLLRSEGKLRPFILSRAFYAGSQRFGSVWTGDNTATWDHLKMSIPMCLSLSVTGITFCGADVGGFFGNSDAELFVRWYQAGAFQPFFRSHSHIDTKRREPWLFDGATKLLIREAIRQRYSYLPLWYTLFYENEKYGIPPMRPLWMEYPADRQAFDMDDQYLVGNALLVHPVTSRGEKEVTVYFPGVNEVWYDTETFEKYTAPGAFKIPVSMSKVPVFQRGGTIIPKKDRIRRASSLTHSDPYSLVVALNTEEEASGTLFIDDFQSFQYRQEQYQYLSLKYSNQTLTATFLDQARFPTKSWLERVVIVGLSAAPAKVEAHSNTLGTKILESSYDSANKVLIIRKPGVSMGEEWRITLH